MDENQSSLELIGSRPPSRLDGPTPRRLLTDRSIDTTRSQHRTSDLNDISRPVNIYSAGRHYQQEKPVPLGQTRTLYRAPQNENKPTSSQSNAAAGYDPSTSQVPFTDHRPPATPSTPGRNNKMKKQYRLRNSSSSYVDETLFGNTPEEATFRAPWHPDTPQKMFTFDCTDYRQRQPRDRPASSARTRSSSMQRINHTPSYADESLFGDKLDSATWRAPWEKPETTKKPLLFDTTDYRLTIVHDNVTPVKQFEYNGSSVRRRTASVENIARKPVWR